MDEVRAPPGNPRTGLSSATVSPDTGRAKEDGPDLEDFFENGVIALHMVGRDGTILRANRAELELLGYAPDDYIGHHIAEFHADRDVIDDILARLKDGQQIRKYPARLRACDGSIRHVEITSSAQFRNGEFVHTRCFTIDVTDLKHARAEVRRKDDQIRQILDVLPAAIYMTDAAGKITYFNRAAVELAGREPRIGEDEWCVTYRLRTVDGRPLPLDQCPMATTLRENRPVRGVEAVAQRPDGSLVPFLPFPTPLRDEEGTLIGAVNMLVDISDRKQAETHQRLLLDELNHRVKNNMQMLYGLLVSALRETESTEAKAVLGAACQRVSAMSAAQRLLYSGDRPRSVGGGEFLNAVCTSVRQAFDADISIHIESDDCSLANEVSMPLALILNELLTNAATHGVEGRGTGDVAVALRRADDQIVLSVEDDGPGFDLQEARQRSSGLGLVRGLARQLGGTFSVERGPGARCVVRFPESRAQG